MLLCLMALCAGVGCESSSSGGPVPIGGPCADTPACVGGAVCRDRICVAIDAGCVRGSTELCACGVGEGLRTCGEDGRYGACACLDAGQPRDARPPVDAALDAAPDAAVDAALDAAVDAGADAEPPRPDAARDARPAPDATPDGAPPAPDAGGPRCTPGARRCLSAREPARCDADGRYVPEARCAGQSECVDGRCIDDPCEVAAARPSTAGCAFLVVDLPNTASRVDGPTPDAPLGVLVHNPSPQAAARLWLRAPDGSIADLDPRRMIEVPDIPDVQARYAVTTVESQVRAADGTVVQSEVEAADGLVVPPGGTATLLLRRELPDLEGSAIRAAALRLLADRPVTATQANPYCCNYSFSNDASTLLPLNVLGRRHRFVGVPAFNPPGDLPRVPTLAVAAPGDGVLVDVRLPPGVTVRPDPQRTFVVEGARLQVRLNTHEVLYLQGTPGGPDGPTDLTGTEIDSSAPVAVFSGHPCANYPADRAGCDHLEVQLPPRTTWGTRFALGPPPRRSAHPDERGYWKLVADDLPARLTFTPSFAERPPAGPGYAGEVPCADLLEGAEVLLEVGQSCVVGSAAPWDVTGDAPFAVLGLVSGQDTTGAAAPFGARAGDPAAFVAAPIAHWATRYDFAVPPTVARNHLVLVSAPDNPLRLDDQAIDLASGVRTPSGEHVYLTVSVSAGAHRLVGVRPFSAVWVGYDDFVGVARTLGLDLSDRDRP
ncbi:MAG: IgGFc-binding protein [Myxococcales bacterium]|nr:IgGFc-binding protein [Myxococcales bacterium]